jgi:hypothetical protein
MKSFFIKSIGIIILVIGSWVLIAYYPYIFSKKIKGEVTSVERIEVPVALMATSQGEMSSKVFSFAIGIKDPATGEIHTASSEDRQWAVAQAGYCVEAEFLPYPPWALEKKGTYYGARLIRLYECGSAASQE